MRKLFVMIVILFIMYFLYQIGYMFFAGERTLVYEVKDGEKTIKITEIVRVSTRELPRNHSLLIEVDGASFNLLTFHDFRRIRGIVTEVKHFREGRLNCIFVKYLEDTILHDVICKNNNYMIAYNRISNPSNSLKEFVSSLTSYGYVQNNWLDRNSAEPISPLTLYQENLPRKHFIAASKDFGFYRVNHVDNVANVSVSSTRDRNKIYGFVRDKFVTISGENLFINNIDNSGQITGNVQELSSSSHIVGSVRNSLFIFDPTNQRQYELNIRTRRMLEVGNQETGIVFYENGERRRRPLNEMNMSTLSFNENSSNDYTNPEYSKIVYSFGYYYLFKRENNRYRVFRSTLDDVKNIRYLFTTPTIDRVFFVEDFIYYVSGTSLFSYSDTQGLRRVFDYDQLADRSTLITVYAK